MNSDQKEGYWLEREVEEGFRGPQVAGIDYSLNSPAVAICPIKIEAWDISYVSIGFFGKEHRSFYHSSGMEFFELQRKDWTTDVERYMANASPMAFLLERKFVVEAAIEGYAYGATGKVFQIGENTGCLKTIIKSRLLLESDIVAPTTIKRYATSSGRADKNQMYAAWLEETGIDLLNRFSPRAKKNIGSPVSDIVDAYYICKWKWHNVKKER